MSDAYDIAKKLLNAYIPKTFQMIPSKAAFNIHFFVFNVTQL